MAKVSTCLFFFFSHTRPEYYRRLNLAVQLQLQFVDTHERFTVIVMLQVCRARCCMSAFVKSCASEIFYVSSSDPSLKGSTQDSPQSWLRCLFIKHDIFQLLMLLFMLVNISVRRLRLI